MKKKIAITAIFVFIALTIYLNCYYQEKSNNEYDLIKIGETEEVCSVVFSSRSTNDEEIYQDIVDTLCKFNANLYCFDMEEVDGKEVYTKYVYATKMYKFENLPLEKGRFFDKSEMESDLYLSNKKTKDPNQIGRIATFGRGDDFQIKTLKEYVTKNDNAFRKTFVLDLLSSVQFRGFSDDLKAKGIYVEAYAGATGRPQKTSYIVGVALFATFVLLIIILYDLIKSYKQIGIEKMLGYDFYAIWGSRIPPLVLWEMVVFVGIAFICSLFLFPSFNVLMGHFLGEVFILYLLIGILTFGMTSFPFNYVENISIVNVLKNRKPLKTIMIFNCVVKTILSIVLILVLTEMYNQISLVFITNQSRFDNWKKMENYAYVPDLMIKDETFDSFSPENMKKWKTAYLDINKRGGIMADFSYYSPLYAENFNENEFPWYRTATVNPNYLKLFPIKDENGNVIDVSEAEKNWVVLIPEMYKNRKEELQSFSKGQLDNDLPEQKNKQIKIIWMENDQKLFTGMLDVRPEEGNCVENPLVFVMTEGNLSVYETLNGIGSTGAPLKIKVGNGKDPKPEVDEILTRHFDKETIGFSICGVYQGIEDQVKIAEKVLTTYTIFFIVLLVLGFVIIMQGITAYMERYKKILAVKKFFGYRLFDKYIAYFGCLLVCYILAGGIAFWIKTNMETVYCVCGMFLVDIVFSFIFISIQDRKNVIQITKGDLR